MSATRIDVDGIGLIISLLFSSLLVLLASSFYILRSDIELQLISDVSERLAEEQLQLNVDFNGRDGIIGGSVTSEKERKDAIAIAESVEGVRTIKDELTIVTIPTGNSNTDNIPSELPTITGEIKANAPTVKSSDSITSITPITPISSETKTNNYTVTEEKENSSKNLTEMTQKPIIEELSIPFQADIIKLSSKQESSLNTLAIKLMNDLSLFLEISSAHLKSKIAIKRATLIKNFLEKQGVNKNHFDIIWDSSENKNSVQLRLFKNK